MNNFPKMTKLNIFYFTYSNYLKLKTINFDKMSSATALLRNRPYLERSYFEHRHYQSINNQCQCSENR